MDSTNTTEADRRDGSALERGVRRPRKSASLTETLQHAAMLLEQEAASLRACHTVHGRRPKGEGSARAAYDEMRATAAQLRKAYRYMAPNFLGGPAKVFDACADAIRAGDPVESAMANFGLAWAPNAEVTGPPCGSGAPTC